MGEYLILCPYERASKFITLLESQGFTSFDHFIERRGDAITSGIHNKQCDSPQTLRRTVRRLCEECRPKA
jgi:hypothetical protein